MQSEQRTADMPGGAGGLSRHRTVRLPFGPQAVRAARARVVDDLVARRMPQEVIDEAESVVAELVTNALRHATPLPDGSVRVHWQARDGVVEVEVSDGGGRTRPAALPPAQYAASGRGLRIVRSLAHEWGVIDAGVSWSAVESARPGSGTPGSGTQGSGTPGSASSGCPGPAGPAGRTVWASVGGPSRRRAW